MNKLAKGARPYKNNNQLIGGNPEIEYVESEKGKLTYTRNDDGIKIISFLLK